MALPRDPGLKRVRGRFLREAGGIYPLIPVDRALGGSAFAGFDSMNPARIQKIIFKCGIQARGIGRKFKADES